MDEVNDALLQVSPTVLMGDFNAHVGKDADTMNGLIGKHGVTGVNQNGRYLLQVCCSNMPASRIPYSSTERFTNTHGIDLVCAGRPSEARG